MPRTAMGTCELIVDGPCFLFFLPSFLLPPPLCLFSRHCVVLLLLVLCFYELSKFHACTIVILLLASLYLDVCFVRHGVHKPARSNLSSTSSLR